MHKIKTGKKEVLLAVCSALICLFICDLILRCVYPPVHKAAKYGWSNPKKYIKKKIVEDSPGKFRKVTVEYFENGFKRWGNVDTKKIKMLILGDSYTEMELVSNGEEWYSYLEKKFENLELFVYGKYGYGTLQEFMVLDDFIDKIRPQIILMQFYANDFDNNLYALDARMYPHNNHAVRPYLETDKIVYKLPLPLAKLRSCSFIADRVLAQYDKFVSDRVMKDLPAYIEAYSKKEKERIEKLSASKSKKAAEQRLQREAFAVTNRIYGMIRERAGKNTPIYLLDAKDNPRVEEICRANNITCFSGIEKELVSKEKEGVYVRIVNDGHWNKLGNELVGNKLIEYFEKAGFEAASPK